MLNLSICFLTFLHCSGTAEAGLQDAIKIREKVSTLLTNHPMIRCCIVVDNNFFFEGVFGSNMIRREVFYGLGEDTIDQIASSGVDNGISLVMTENVFKSASDNFICVPWVFIHSFKHILALSHFFCRI